MSERKSINRYYPPNEDPSKVKFSNKISNKTKNGKPKAYSVRAMAPFSMKCLKCKEYIAKSRKFNVRKETTDRDYLGIKILRFSLRCPRCYAELIYETDPKNADFQCVSGCKKNYERSAPIKENESIDEMIVRLEKESKEDERMKELERKGGKKNGLTSEETGMEQLEKRLVEQQKEKERVEELEELQEQMHNLEQRRNQMDEATRIRTTSKADKVLPTVELDQEAKRAFDEFKKKKEKKQSAGVLSTAYSSSSDEGEEEEAQMEDKDSLSQHVVGSKRSLLEPIKGIVRRKKTKILL
ncbi:hypothetical protein PMKS-002946 [Pichia membranifaciens]|uniref:Splicing factor YJU2 n=1 Tax=Pichia membranifaciens TaxID=4926 RepID=A0A1Q2YIR5_9ASCO|nr:hypothetical protein PMKS-002946 [Pichia membranifaciens]